MKDLKRRNNVANFSDAILWVLKFEDSTLSGKTVILADGAGRTRFGIAEKDHPSPPLSADFYTTDKLSALAEAESIYRTEYWNVCQGDLLISDELAATLLSFGVNDGIHTAIKLLQECLGVEADGEMGPITLAKANSTPTAAASLRAAQAARYRELVTLNPKNKQFEDDWLRRANAVYPIS